MKNYINSLLADISYIDINKINNEYTLKGNEIFEDSAKSRKISQSEIDFL